MSVEIRKLNSSDQDFREQLMAVLAFEASEDEAIDRAAASILADVRQRGDAAVLEYTNTFDRLSATHMTALEIPRAERKAALVEALAGARTLFFDKTGNRFRGSYFDDRGVGGVVGVKAAGGAGYCEPDEKAFLQPGHS